MADATGDVAAMALFAGEGVGEIAEVLPAGDIVRLFGERAAGLLGTRAC